MPGIRQDVSQSVRLLYLAIYLSFLFLMNFLAFGEWLPLTTSKGLWFYSGAAALILGSLLVTPYFTSPANAISYLIAALVGILAFDIPNASLRNSILRLLIVIFLLVMLILSVISIILKDSKNRFSHNIANLSQILADNLGSPRFVYAIVIFYALWEYHFESPSEMFFIAISGIVIAAQQPVEIFGSIIKRIASVWRPSSEPNVVGFLVAHQMPNLLLIRENGTENINPGSCLLVSDEYSVFKIGLALGYFGRDEGILLRALEINLPVKYHPRLKEVSKRIPNGSVCILSQQEIATFQEDIYPLKNSKSIVGIVASETNTERLYFEITEDKDLEQGRLVETFVSDKLVLYQVLNGLTKEEIIQQKNTYGFARGEATQIGIWDEGKRKFIPCNWIAKINSPVFLKTKQNHGDNPEAIGYFPSTNFEVSIKDLNEMVTHNTAILGILGVGKTMLAIELVERMIVGKIKVICIDLTSQYTEELKSLFKIEDENKKDQKLKEIGQSGKTRFKQNVEEGGSKKLFALQVKSDLEEFLAVDNEVYLKIVNPSSFEVWRQDSKMYNDSASMATLTPTEITQIISESTLEIVQKFGMTNKARVCLVYEEAHSLIPEWNSIAVEGDKVATNGTARAILQGRKYGLGCLLITQRTANVTKTILNQCNTIFAMRTFDDTGKEFLSNYLGSEYASKLSSLRERHAIFFGRASSCENPVMIRLNDRADFLRAFHSS